jgi:hypothetical protein
VASPGPPLAAAGRGAAAFFINARTEKSPDWAGALSETPERTLAPSLTRGRKAYDARFRRTRQFKVQLGLPDKSRVGHDAPCPGVLWQVPARCEERRVGTHRGHGELAILRLA